MKTIRLIAAMLAALACSLIARADYPPTATSVLLKYTGSTTTIGRFGTVTNGQILEVTLDEANQAKNSPQYAVVKINGVSSALWGHGTPEAVEIGWPGWTFVDVDANTLYLKATGEDSNTGWVIVTSGGGGTIAASQVISGIFTPARLGGGTPTGDTFLNGTTNWANGAAALQLTNAFEKGITDRSGIVRDAIYTITGTAPVISYTNGLEQRWVLTANSSFTLANAPTDPAKVQWLSITVVGNGSFTLALPTGATWAWQTSTNGNPLVSGETEFVIKWNGSVFKAAQLPDPFFAGYGITDTLAALLALKANAASATLTSPTLNTATINYPFPLAADDTSYGHYVTLTNSGGVTQWDAVYVNSSSQWALADANGSSTYPAFGLATATVSTGVSTTVIVMGIVRNDGWSWTAGGQIYLSETAGGLTQTRPTAGGSHVQVVGKAVSATTILLRPSQDVGDL